MINRPFRSKKCLSEMIWHFIGVYIINRTLHGRLEIRNFSSRVKKYFTSECVEKYFTVRCAHSNTTLEGKFRISARPCNILYLSYLFTLFDVILFQSISSNHVM